MSCAITKGGKVTIYFVLVQRLGQLQLILCHHKGYDSHNISYYHKERGSHSLFHVTTKSRKVTVYFILSQSLGQPELISCHHKGRAVTFHAITKGGTARTYFMSSQRARSHISCYQKGWDSQNLFHVITKDKKSHFMLSQRVG